MERLFLTVWHMSLAASLVILVVLAVRLCLKKAPKVFSYALWAVVLARLLCPVTVDSPVGLVPSARSLGRGAETVIDVPAQGPDTAPVPAIPADGTQMPDDTVTNIRLLSPAVRVQKGPSWMTLAAWLWLCGVAGLAAYSLVSLLGLKRELREAVPLEGQEGVCLAEGVPTPFVLGLLRPRIYLPAGLPREEWDYILLHERTHIRRLDHVVKALAWLAVLLHWFNPLVWLAFRLAGRDMEMSCDESVLKELGPEVRGDYSQSLLRLSAGKGLPAGPLAFGDGDAKGRIKNILNYKKPTLWVLLLALLVVAAAVVALLTGRAVRPGAVEVEVAFDHVGNDLTSSFFVPEDVLDAAKEYVRQLYPTDGMRAAHWGEYNASTGQYEEWPDPPAISFDGARLESMKGPWAKEWRGQQLEIWQLNYEYHTDADAGLIWDYFIVGGMYLTEDGWLCNTYPNSTFLIFTVEGEKRQYVDAIMNNTDDPGSGDFWQSMADRMVELEDWELSYSTPTGDGSAGVAVSGLDGLTVTWSADTSPSRGHLYFSGDWGTICPGRTGWKIAQGTAIWSDEARTALSVTMNVDWGQGEKLVYFEVALSPEHYVLQRPDLVETVQPGDDELMSTARTLAKVMDGAEAYQAALTVEE